MSYSVEQQAGEATLKWRGGDDGTVPDSFSVVGASPLAGGVAEMKLYAGKVVGWEGPDGGERGSRVPDVLMKEYCNEIAASMADAEVEAVGLAATVALVLAVPLAAGAVPSVEPDVGQPQSDVAATTTARAGVALIFTGPRELPVATR